MAWKFAPDRPVYLQIAERLTRSVLAGDYPPGSQLPSVRQLAIEAAVNPNTVQHAFTDLENQGLLLVKGTVGRFVTEDQAVLENSRRSLAQSMAKEFLENMAQLSFSAEEAVGLLKEAVE